MKKSFLLVSTLFVSLLLVSTTWGFRARGGFGVKFGFELGGGGGVEGEVGDPCVPTSPRTCGERTFVSGPEVEQLSDEENRTNVCRYTFMFEVSIYEYELMRSEKCEKLAGIFGKDPDNCPLFCRCTGVCSTMTVPEEVTDCCEGFTTERPTPLQIVNGEDAEFNGCPISITCPEPEDPTTDEGDGLVLNK